LQHLKQHKFKMLIFSLVKTNQFQNFSKTTMYKKSNCLLKKSFMITIKKVINQLIFLTICVDNNYSHCNTNFC